MERLENETKNSIFTLIKEYTMPRFLTALFLAVLMSSLVYAGEYGFETTSEGIVESLTRTAPKETPRTRSWSRITPSSRTIKVVKKDHGKTVEKLVSVNETQPVQSVNLKIEFDSNSYVIRPDSFRLLNELGKAVTSDRLRNKSLAIKGHTDSDGSGTYNLKLSLNRALAVKNYLVGNFGIEGNRLKVIGYGEALPLVPNASSANKQINRRVEVQVASE